MKCSKCDFENPADTRFCGNCAAPLHPSEEESALPTKTLQTTPIELKTGTVFAGRFEVIEDLGKGGMGKVYKVLDKEVNEKIALKLLKPEIATDEKTIERFRNELKFARKIGHPNVCRMYDLNREGDTHYITMELVSGEDLKSTITRIGQFPVGKAISIAKQVCEGLAEAHRLGVVHRDLKPQNIMLDKEGNARIMDFGIARSLKTKGLTGAGVMIGTPEYMSPEQVEVRDVDQRSDIYSLGVILYEMVTGRLPFEGETSIAIAMKHKSEAPQDPGKINPQLSEALSRVILKCLDKDKEKRYQSAGEVRAVLEAIEKGMPTTERVVPKRKPITSKEITVTFSMKKLLIPALVVVAVIVAVLLAWQLLPQRERAKTSIAVISFENQTGERSYDYLQKAIPNLLITSLEQSKYLSVMTWERMHDLLKQLGKEETEVIDRELGFELCSMDNVRAIVLGSFVKAGDVFATDVKVLDIKTKKILKSAQSKGEGVGSILDKQIGELSKEISRGIGLSEQKIEPAQLRIADLTTSSMDAYNYFLQGREEYEKFYYADARKSLEKAVELDPEFAVAYLYLAQTLGSLGMSRERNAAREKAKALAQKASEKERLYIEASYASRGDRLSILKEMAEKYPKEKQVHFELAQYYDTDEMFDKAIEEYEKALELDPNYGYALNAFAYMHSDMGNYEKALEYFKKYASVNPDDANPFDSMAELYFRMGRLDEAIAKYKEALEIKPDFYQTNWRIGYIHALKEDYNEAREWVDRDIAAAPTPGAKMTGYFWKSFFGYWQGNLDQALYELQRSADIANAVGSQTSRAMVYWLSAYVYQDRGEYVLSRENFTEWLNIYLKTNPTHTADFKALYANFLGFVDLKEGSLDAAKSRLSEMESLLSDIHPFFKDWVQFGYDVLKGEIFLAEGSVEKAIIYLEKAPPVGKSSAMQFIAPYNFPFIKDVLARCYQKKGELNKAIDEYERLVTFDPKAESRCLIHPIYHYRLARLYEEKGWKEKAIEHYERFLDFWKDADDIYPQPEDARKRLTALK